MAFPKSPSSSPAITTTYLALIFLMTLFFFTTTTGEAAASRNSSFKTSENPPQPPLFHAVTGNLSAITAKRVNTSTSTKLGSGGDTSFSFFCFSNYDCAFAGPNATCWNYQCICDLDYLSVNSSCTKFTCWSTYDCLWHFCDTRCDEDNSCVCNYDTRLDLSSQSCITSVDDLLALKISLPISLLFVAILVACCCCCFFKRRQKRQKEVSD